MLQALWTMQCVVTTTQLCHGGVRAATGGADSSGTLLMDTGIGMSSNRAMKWSSFDLFLTIWKCTNYSQPVGCTKAGGGLNLAR